MLGIFTYHIIIVRYRYGILLLLVVSLTTEHSTKTTKEEKLYTQYNIGNSWKITKK